MPARDSLNVNIRRASVPRNRRLTVKSAMCAVPLWSFLRSTAKNSWDVQSFLNVKIPNRFQRESIARAKGATVTSSSGVPEKGRSFSGAPNIRNARLRRGTVPWRRNAANAGIRFLRLKKAGKKALSFDVLHARTNRHPPNKALRKRQTRRKHHKTCVIQRAPRS